MSTGVISEGSTRGMGLPLSSALDTMPCHCGGRPTYLGGGTGVKGMVGMVVVVVCNFGGV